MNTTRLCMLAMTGLLIVAALAGTASAHSVNPTSDGKYDLIVGNLNEPTTTYMKTGLDLIIQDHATKAPITVRIHPA